MNDTLNVLCPMLVQFAEVARTGQVTRAAERLGVPQPTVTRHIARLENQLGTRLFVRSARGLEMTEDGRRLLEPVEEALSAINRGVSSVQPDLSPPPVSLGFLHTLGEIVVPDLIRAFGRVAPDVRFALGQDSADRLLADLSQGSLDLCLVSPKPPTSGVDSRQIGAQRLVLAVPESHELAGVESTPLAAAASDDFVTLVAGNYLRRTADALCRTTGFEPRVVFEASGVSTVRGLVAVGMGVAIVPPAPVPTSGLVEVPLIDDGAYREIALAWRSDVALSPHASEFREFVVAGAPQHAEWLKGLDPTMERGRR